jgi:hypothetical protein
MEGEAALILFGVHGPEILGLRLVVAGTPGLDRGR